MTPAQATPGTLVRGRLSRFDRYGVIRSHERGVVVIDWETGSVGLLSWGGVPDAERLEVVGLNETTGGEGRL